MLALIIVACAICGLKFTAADDARLEVARRDAVRAALAETPPVLDAEGRVGPDQLRVIARHAGLEDLRFDTDLLPEPQREAQSLHDAQGRIVGWLSWRPDRGFLASSRWLWQSAGVIGGVLALCGLALWLATARLARSAAANAAAVDRLTSEDTLTGLPNRATLLRLLDDVLAARGEGATALALIDIDNFQDVNDSLGRAGGDTMLLAIAGRLAAALPEGATLGRFDDDEFAVVASGADAGLAAALGEKLAGALAEPIYLDQMWQIGASVGIAQAPEDGTTGDELFRRALLALRSAKQNFRGSVRRFIPEIQEERSERRFLLRELEAAIKNESFDVHYQPVVAAEGGRIVGVEALLRWTHPVRGIVPPSAFIPLAEESGLMIELGDLVLRRAAAEAARWPSLFVSVNLSPVQMRNPGLVEDVATIIARSGLACSRLVLEVTEGVLIEDPEAAQKTLKALHKIGVSTALDDFGTGYSSLNYLQKFPFDRLKIDRAFVASLGSGGNTGAIIQAIVTLGHALGMKVLAEGVETNEQRVLLRLAGCDEMQGFLFARPIAAADIDALLAAASTRGMAQGG
jgi:diguanylate cyclase (GGDEF)-like protein